MRDCQKQQGESEAPRNSKSDVEASADQKPDANRVLHLFSRLARPAPRDDWSDCRPDTARGEQDADAGRGLASHRKNSLAEHGQQSQNAAAHSPRRFHHQVSKDSWPMLDVTCAFDRVADAERFCEREFCFRARRPLRKSHARNQSRGRDERKGVEHEGRVGSEPACYQATERRAQRQHRRPGDRGNRIRGEQLAIRNDRRNRGSLGRLEERRERKLQDSQDVYQPHLIGTAHQ